MFKSLDRITGTMSTVGTLSRTVRWHDDNYVDSHVPEMFVVTILCDVLRRRGRHPKKCAGLTRVVPKAPAAIRENVFLKVFQPSTSEDGSGPSPLTNSSAAILREKTAGTIKIMIYPPETGGRLTATGSHAFTLPAKTCF